MRAISHVMYMCVLHRPAMRINAAGTASLRTPHALCCPQHADYVPGWSFWPLFSTGGGWSYSSLSFQVRATSTRAHALALSHACAAATLCRLCVFACRSAQSQMTLANPRPRRRSLPPQMKGEEATALRKALTMVSAPLQFASDYMANVQMNIHPCNLPMCMLVPWNPALLTACMLFIS